MKRKAWIIMITLLVIALVIIIYQGIRQENNDARTNENGVSDEKQSEVFASTLSEPTYKDVSVHDPSIIKVDDAFYVFGTHIEAAKSSDLMSWERFSNGYTTPGNVLYGDLSENLQTSFLWAGEDDADASGGFAVWAPDIFWNEHYINDDGTTGAFMMHYSASSTYVRSAIGFAVSKDIEGPYRYVDTLVYSGFTENEVYDENSDVNKQWKNTHLNALIADGKISDVNEAWFNADGSFNNRHYPNAIDANVFFDTEGQLYMTYGSWSGGIFILELDKETGAVMYPKADGETDDGRMIDRYFGTKISGGYYESGEGPYIEYNPETGFYYLYVTYGWLGADGGYHMRQFKSADPMGPYIDAAGAPAVLPPNQSNTQFGNKLMGNFLFLRDSHEPGFGPGQGYMSPGHNSVYTDPDTGQQFLVFHTRFPNQGESFQMRIHQMFMNKHDWGVVAPKRYAGEVLNNEITEQDIAGTYKYINHGKDSSDVVKESTKIELHTDGTITGAIDGMWQKDGYYATITINDVTYDGVFVEVWDELNKQGTLSFTALSETGVSIWGVQAIEETREAKEIAVDIANDLTVPSEVTGDVTLKTEAIYDTTITWESSHPSVLSTDGEVVRRDGEDVEVTLVATITHEGEVVEKTFDVTIVGVKEATIIAHYAFDGDLSDQTGNHTALQPMAERIDIEGDAVAFKEGVTNQAVFLDGTAGLRLNDGLISTPSYTISLFVKPYALTQHTTVFFGANNPDEWMSVVPFGHNDQTLLWAGSTTWFDASANRRIEIDVWSHIAVAVDGDRVRLYLDGEEMFHGEGIPYRFDMSSYFALGVNHWDVPFEGLIDEVKVFDGALTAKDIKEFIEAL